MNILVTGGAGYIGSHTVRELADQGHEVIVLDNFSNGHNQAVDSRAAVIEGNTGDERTLRLILSSYQIDAAMHFAADIEVGESVVDPSKYYRNNFSNSLTLMENLREGGVKKIVFSSTAAVYGEPDKTPIDETQTRQPINPYGRSKMMTEMALEDFCRAYKIGYTILRYFNVAGAHPSGLLGEDHHPETHLIPRILKAAKENDFIKIYGTDYPTKDGTCIRDYIHVVDLARAHVLALKKMESGDARIYNLGSENGFSVREVISACEKVTGKNLKIKEEARRPGDPAILVASSQKIRRELGWERNYPHLETIVRHAWQWHSNHPQGYATKIENHSMISEATAIHP